ncbi:hypothetical protein [Mesorhizobium tianshanense]|uniref:hypothetical protein n=1 Tax=Mesorhizobium tianshanense TaxID=39844 RepID=UPI0012DF2ADC|nr:hypothetical protein [Mesorhizobium tianshanense]
MLQFASCRFGISSVAAFKQKGLADIAHVVDMKDERLEARESVARLVSGHDRLGAPPR